jgi:hypothetical protein
MFDKYFHLISTIVFLASPLKEKKYYFISKNCMYKARKISKTYVINVSELCALGCYSFLFGKSYQQIFLHD